MKQPATPNHKLEEVLRESLKFAPAKYKELKKLEKVHYKVAPVLEFFEWVRTEKPEVLTLPALSKLIFEFHGIDVDKLLQEFASFRKELSVNNITDFIFKRDT